MRPESVLAALLCFLLAFSAFSCSVSELPPGDGSKNQNVLRIDIGAPMESLDPCEDTTSGSTSVFPLLFSYLFVETDPGQLEMDLATSWYYEDDNHTWVIHIRDDALFHDGRRVTTEDVEYSLRHNLRAHRPAVLSQINQITRPTATSLHIKLKKHDPDFLLKIWDTLIAPGPGKGMNDVHSNPVGSGPFKFHYRDGKREVGLSANDKYYGNTPSLERIVFYFEPDREKSWARLLLGKTDIVHRLYPKDYQIISQYHDRFRFDALVPEYYTILLFNTFDPILADPDVRIALSHAVDRQYIIDKVFHGAATAAIGPAGIKTPYRDSSLMPVPYDPEKAMEILHGAGWSLDVHDQLLHKGGTPFELEILAFEGDQVDTMVAECLQFFLNDVGIKTHLNWLPHDELLRRYVHNNAFQAVLTEFRAGSTIPEIMQPLWAFTNGQRSAAGMFDHPDVNRLFNEAVRAEDPFERRVLYSRIDALIISLQPGMFLFHKTVFDVMSKRIGFPLRFSSDHSGTYRLRHASLIPTSDTLHK